MIKVTVILCTYNRSAELRNALASLARSQVSPSIDWQVLVVDNNSSDDTRTVVSEFIADHPGSFSYLFEPKTGKSNALNRGLREVDGDILAFTDDDVIVEPSWLENLVRPLQADSAYDGVGGRTLPLGNFQPPEWLPAGMPFALAPLAIFDGGVTPMEMTEPPFGNNMAFRRRVFRNFGDFRLDLGPRPGSEIRCEDTEFAQRLLAAGSRLWYEPSALLYHTIAQKRLNRDFFLAWWRDKARTDVRVACSSMDCWKIAGVPLVLFRRLLRWALQFLVSFDPAQRFLCRIQMNTLIGYIREYYALAHAQPAQPAQANASATAAIGDSSASQL